MGRRGRPRMPRQVERAFWRLIAAGRSTAVAAEAVGVAVNTGQRWFAQAGGMSPVELVEPSGRYLSFAEREEIALGRAAGLSMRAIARRLGRDPGTVSRELGRYDGADRYKASVAQAAADERARRPKQSKLARHPRLRAFVAHQLAEQQWSPEQIAARLIEEFPDDECMRISHEAIYQSLYVQGRGELRRELTA